MAAETVDAGSGHPVFAGLALIEQGLDQVLQASTWSLDDRQVSALIVGLTRVGSRVEAARGAALRESICRETPDARGEQGARTVNLLKSRCRVSPKRASADVANAKLTCPDTGTLRELGAALAEGAVSREHLDVGRSTLKRLPGRVVRERRDEVDHLLTEHARGFDPGGSDYLARHLLSVITPDRADRYDENALDRRHLSVATDQTGMVLLSGQLDQCTGLKFAAVLDHVVETDRATGGDGADGGEPDLRTRGQRRADALGRDGRRRRRVPRPRRRQHRPAADGPGRDRGSRPRLASVRRGRCRGSWSSPPPSSSPAPTVPVPRPRPTAPWSTAAP